MKKPEETKKTPNEIVADRIVKALAEKSLLSKDRVAQLRKHILAGTLEIEEAERLFEFDPQKGQAI